VVTASGGLVELGYSQITSIVTVSSTTEGASGTSVIPALTVVCDGSPVLVEFCASRVHAAANAAGNITVTNLLYDGVNQGRLSLTGTGSNTEVIAPAYTAWRMTPSAGSHTFAVTAFRTNANGFVWNDSNGRAFLRVSKIVTATQWPAVTTGTIICTSSTRPASPFAGQQIYETDTSLSYTYSGSAWVQTGNLGAWTTFTPQLRTGTTNVASTNNYGRYIVQGKMITAQAKVTATAVGTASGAIKLSIPTGTAVNGADATIGAYLIKDTGTAYYTGVAGIVEAGYVSGQAYNSADNMGANTPAMTIAVGDVVSYSVTYEIA